MSGGDSPSSKPSNKLYVGNLDYKVTSEELSSHFKAAQGFVSAEVSITTNGRSKGFGLVEFSSPAAATSAVEKFNETTIGERKIFVRLDRGTSTSTTAGNGASRREGTQRQPRVGGGVRSNNFNRSNIAPLKVRAEDEGRLLYVGNIPWRSSWQDIKDHFKEVGSVIRADIPVDKETRRSRGFATVLFEKEEDAAAAIEKLNNTEMGGRQITVRFDQFVGKRN